MYQEVWFNPGTEAGGGVNVDHSLSPPSHFMLATGLKFERKLRRHKQRLVRIPSTVVLITASSYEPGWTAWPGVRDLALPLNPL